MKVNNLRDKEKLRKNGDNLGAPTEDVDVSVDKKRMLTLGEIDELIENAMFLMEEHGMVQNDACKHAGVPVSTFNKRMSRNTALRERFKSIAYGVSSRKEMTYTEITEMCEQIVSLYGKGIVSITGLCQAIGLPYSTFKTRIKADESLAKKYEESKTAIIPDLEEQLISLSNGPVKTETTKIYLFDESGKRYLSKEIVVERKDPPSLKATMALLAARGATGYEKSTDIDMLTAAEKTRKIKEAAEKHNITTEVLQRIYDEIRGVGLKPANIIDVESSVVNGDNSD